MSNERTIHGYLPTDRGLRPAPGIASVTSCERDAEGHCITCSDEAVSARVVRIDQQMGIAFVRVDDVIEEVDITLVDDVVPGDVLLVHGGVAIANTGTITPEKLVR